MSDKPVKKGLSIFGYTITKDRPATEKGYTLTNDEGWVNTSWDEGFWQQNRSISSMGLNETVEACVSAISQTVAMCPIVHRKENEDGSMDRMFGSNLERVMRFPNPYESRTGFFNNILRCMYFTGNGIAYATRDERGAISRLDLVDPKSSYGTFSAEDDSIW